MRVKSNQTKKSTSNKFFEWILNLICEFSQDHLKLLLFFQSLLFTFFTNFNFLVPDIFLLLHEMWLLILQQKNMYFTRPRNFVSVSMCWFILYLKLITKQIVIFKLQQKPFFFFSFFEDDDELDLIAIIFYRFQIFCWAIRICF